MDFVNGPWPQLLDFAVNSREAFWATFGVVLSWIFRKQVQECCVHGYHGTASVWRFKAKTAALLAAALLFVLLPVFPLLTYPGLLSKAVLLSAGIAGLAYAWHTFRTFDEWYPEKVACLVMFLLMWTLGFGAIGLAGVWFY